MEENNEENAKSLESPKPLAFTIDFGNSSKSFTNERHKYMVEKYQKKHRRGQSLSKIEDSQSVSTATNNNKKPLTGNLPRKFSFQSEGYFSSDEKSSRASSAKRSDLSLPLKNTTQITKAPTNLTTPDIELKDISSPELDLISPFSPNKPPQQLQHKPQMSSPDFEAINDFDKKSDISDAGTYTLDADNYSEEQKARMSIDAVYKLEQVSVLKKTEDYIKSLAAFREDTSSPSSTISKSSLTTYSTISTTNKLANKFIQNNNNKVLSPILSPTQNLSIVEDKTILNNGESDSTANTTFTKIMFPSPKSKTNIFDQGSVISVTSSGAFRKNDPIPSKKLVSLSKSEVQVEAYYVGDSKPKLTANIINVQSICKSGGGSPTKIPSPVHTISRPRSRNSISSVNVDFSDSSLETESYLKPTQNLLNSLQQRLSLDSEDSDCGLQLNNTAHKLLKQKGLHIRHNSLDDKISNKLEHFQNKNLQSIDQTLYMFNQYNQKSGRMNSNKIYNSPNSNNSPIRRSSSFSNKQKNTNIQKESNLKNSPNLARSASTANIKPAYLQLRRSSLNKNDKIDRNQFGDTESSSEEDLLMDKNQKKKDLTTTRYNRAFSLRRARLDDTPPKCPNTPEMRRKFQDCNIRAISVDRKSSKSEVQSRYLLNATKKNSAPAKIELNKNVPKPSKPLQGKSQVFSRTDSGRFSMRAAASKPPPTPAAAATPPPPPPPPISGAQPRKKYTDKKSGGRSNSSLSSREMEFQNWKRRKSYDPMKAAAEGKRKELAKRQGNIMTQSYNEANNANQDCDSSPSHSSSVHRSQSFHGTAALEQLLSSEEDDLTLSVDEGFSPPTPSPCELSPTRSNWRNHILH